MNRIDHTALEKQMCLQNIDVAADILVLEKYIFLKKIINQINIQKIIFLDIGVDKIHAMNYFLIILFLGFFSGEPGEN